MVVNANLVCQRPWKPLRIRVHVLYKRPEIPANGTIRAFAVSVTYRKHEKAQNPGFDSR